MGEEYIPLGKPIPLRIDQETEILIQAIAEITKEKNAAIMRRYIYQGVRAEMMMKFGLMDEVLSVVRKAVTETNKPFEERIAKITSKNAIAAYTSLFLNQEVIGQLGKKDVRQLSEEARKRAVAALRAKESPEDKLINGDMNE